MRGSAHSGGLRPFDDIPRVALDFEESVHFGLGKDAFRDWENIREEEFRHRLYVCLELTSYAWQPRR